MDPHPELARDRLAQADLAVGPDVPPVPVDGEHADRAIEDDDRRREGRPRAQGEEDGAALVLELRLDVGDCNGAAGPRGDVRDRETLGLGASDRIDAVVHPLGLDRQRAFALPQTDEAARQPEGRAHFLERDAYDRLEVELGTDLARDRGEQSLPIEGILQGGGRAGPIERDRRLGREGAQRPELGRGERTPLLRRRDREHADHTLAGDERDEGGAARADRLRDMLLDQRRVRRVEHRDRSDLEHRARNPRGLPAQVEAKLTPVVEVFALTPGEQAPRLGQLLVDQHESRELDVEERCDLVQKDSRDGLGVAGAGDRSRNRLQRRELALAHGGAADGLAASAAKPFRHAGAEVQHGPEPAPHPLHAHVLAFVGHWELLMLGRFLT